jgi:hypothetical protein
MRYRYDNIETSSGEDDPEQTISYERQPIVRQTQSVNGFPYPYLQPQPYISWWSVFTACLFSFSVLLIYMFNIYYSVYLNNIAGNVNMSMWLAINGLFGAVLTINGLIHWIVLMYQDTCYGFLTCVRVTHIITSVFLSGWTIFGYVYFATITINDSAFYTFMWFNLCFQTLFIAFSLMVSYFLITMIYQET